MQYRQSLSKPEVARVAEGPVLLLLQERILRHMCCPTEPFPMSVQPVIAIERIVYHRERAAGMYAAMPYALAQGDVEIPYLVVQTLLWSIITYWMFGFEASAGIDCSALREC